MVASSTVPAPTKNKVVADLFRRYKEPSVNGISVVYCTFPEKSYKKGAAVDFVSAFIL